MAYCGGSIMSWELFLWPNFKVTIVENLLEAAPFGSNNETHITARGTEECFRSKHIYLAQSLSVVSKLIFTYAFHSTWLSQECTALCWSIK